MMISGYPEGLVNKFKYPRISRLMMIYRYSEYQHTHNLLTSAVPLLSTSNLRDTLPSELFHEKKLTRAEIKDIFILQALKVLGAFMSKHYGGRVLGDDLPIDSFFSDT